MRRNNKTRDVTRSPDWVYSTDRVNLGDAPERIRWKDSKQSSYRKSGNRYSASTNVWGLVSIVFLIGLIASVFFAYFNSMRTDGKFQYFSPSTYLENFSAEEIVINPGTYRVNLIEEGYDVLYGTRYRGVVVLSTYTYRSTNTITSLGGIGQELYFDIGGKQYTSIRNFDDQEFYLTIESTIIYNLNDFPRLEPILEYWEDVSDFDSLGVALSQTASFVGKFLTYQAHLIESLLPWNSVEVGESDYLEELWERGQS